MFEAGQLFFRAIHLFKVFEASFIFNAEESNIKNMKAVT